jgi:hypothetical protein
MSDRGTDTVTKPSLATFKRIGQPIDISLTTFLFTDTQLTQGPSGPTANTTLSGVTTLVTPSGAHVAHDGSSAGNASTTTDLGNKFTTFGFVSSGAVNGGTLTGSETVTGIEVLTYGRDTDASVILTSTTNTRRSTPQFPTMKNWSTIQTGGPMDTWGQVWLPADFTNASGFGLEYRARARGGQQPSLTDGITVKIYYTGTSVNRNGVPFRTVTYRSQVGTSVTDSAIQYPPPATTGDVFQGSLVLNSANDPAKLIYSLPDNPDAFPKPYFLRFNLPAKDIVTNIKRLGQILIVGLRDCIQRVNYLPTELDTQITGGGGSAHEDLATDHGIVGPRAACLFDFPGAGPVLAYVSYKGLHITDGVTTKFLNVDLDWVNTVNLDNISTCVLVNYPQEEWLVFFYNPVGASHTQNTRAFVIPYAIDKTKENGTLPVVGPLTVSGRSSCSASISGRTYLLTGHQTLGKVYVEDQGITIAAGYTVADSSGSQVTVTAVPLIKTRRIYPSGLGRQARDQRVYVMTDALGAAITVVSSTTSASATVTSAALFGSVTTGMLVTGDGIQPDTIVTAVGSTSSITLSKAATATGVGVTLTFSTGTLSLTVAGQDTNAALATLETQQQDTRVGGLVVYHADNLKESVEYTFTKATDGSSSFAVAAALRLHYFARMSGAAGQETHRA